MTVLCATDLDRTLIFSRRALGDLDGRQLVCVERYDGADSSWLTAAAADCVERLHAHALVVPVTTRLPRQWQRVRLPGPPPRWVVAANGGVLLVDGEIDTDWRRHVAGWLGDVAPLAEIWEHASRLCRPEWTDALRNADNLFCYAVLRRDAPSAVSVAQAVAETAGWAAARGWRVSLQGRKLYWVPVPLTKSAAVAEVRRRTGASTVLAAGDSLLDADLLEYADAGIAARDGELVAAGWQAPHVGVTAATGGLGGEEIARWLLDRSRPDVSRAAAGSGRTPARRATPPGAARAAWPPPGPRARAD